MATINKTKSQTYDFLSKNKSIEDIKQQPNIEVIEKRRHGGKTFKIIEKNIANNQLINDNLSENNRENLEQVTSNLTNEVKEQETNNDIWTKLINYLNWPTSNTEELIQTQKKYIEQLEQNNLEKNKQIQQLKKENEELNKKQSNVNFDKFKYNAVTIYNERQRKDKGIEKIHEEILPINNQIYFITTIVHINQSISEEILCFQQFQNGDIEIMKQLKQYENLNGYKNDFSLIEENSNDEKNIKIEPISIKDFLNQQTFEIERPTKKEWKTWAIIIGITLFLGVIVPICTFVIPTLIPATATVLLLETKVIIAVSSAVAGIIFKEISSLFENATQNVKSWFKNKYFKSKNQKEKNKKERQSIIKNLTNDKLETKLQTQYEILKQELNNKKDKTINELLNNKTINNSSNIEPLKTSDFDASIRNTINNQNQQPSISSNHNWNKVKCLLT